MLEVLDGLVDGGAGGHTLEPEDLVRGHAEHGAAEGVEACEGGRAVAGVHREGRVEGGGRAQDAVGELGGEGAVGVRQRRRAVQGGVEGCGGEGPVGLDALEHLGGAMAGIGPGREAHGARRSTPGAQAGAEVVVG